MVDFALKVRNPRIASGFGNNVNWSQPPYESYPDVMPSESVQVFFRGMPAEPGSFILWSGRAGVFSPVHGFRSPAVTPTAGATYLWDMSTNTVTREGGGDEISGGIIAWARANPLLAGAIAVGAYVVLFGGRRGMRF